MTKKNSTIKEMVEQFEYALKSVKWFSLIICNY